MSAWYGLHRVINETCLPQAAKKLSTTLPIDETELLIDVETLNIDSSSFRQLMETAEGDLAKVELLIKGIVEERGKMQNPVTGSGGMLIGTVKQKGARSPHDVKVGQKIATLVSLTLTPLKIDKIKKIIPEKEQVQVSGHAILFGTGVMAVLPSDFTAECALSVLDVCGAPAQTYNIVEEADKVAIIGAGKSGLLAALAAHDKLDGTGQVTLFDYSTTALEQLQKLDYPFSYQQMNATNPIEAINYSEKNGEFDLVINVTNVPNCEMNAIILTKDHGKTFFFSMATSFTKASLGAEGIGKDVVMLMGNGYCHNHSNYTFELLRKYPDVRAYYEKKYGG